MTAKHGAAPDVEYLEHSQNDIRDMNAETIAKELDRSAQAVTDFEHSLTLRQAVRLYPKAIGWSLGLSSAIIMEGYDTLLIISFFGLPAFQTKYGQLQPDGTVAITAAWQSGLSNAVTCGEILGVMLNGYVADRFGYRKTMMGSLAALFCLVFIVFFAPNIQTLLIGQLLCGIPWGIFQVLTTTYASEVCPVVLRPYLTTYVNISWVLGQLLAGGVTRAYVHNTTEWAFRIPFAIQWAFPIPIFLVCVFAPESPWFLVRKGRIEEAERSVERLTSKVDGFNVDVKQQVEMMVHTNAMESYITKGTSFVDCFRGTNLRRTEITLGIYAVQMLCGSTLIFSSAFFLEQAGLPASYSFDVTTSQFGLGAIATLASWWFIARMTRRSLYLSGLGLLGIILLIIGILAVIPKNNGASWAQGAMLIVFTGVYDFSVGPLCFSLITEIPSTRLKQKTVVMARALYNIIQIVANILNSYMINPTAWNWQGKAGFFWFGVTSLCFTWAFLRLVEPKGKTFEEMDILFEAKVRARDFKSADVNQILAERNSTIN